MMQDAVLRVVVVALGLLTYPGNDPGVEKQHDITEVDMQKYEERLLLGGDTLDHEMAPAREEITHTNKKSPGMKGKPTDPDQNVTKVKDQIIKDVTVAQEDEGADPKLREGGHFISSLTQNSRSESETREDDPSHGSLRDPSRAGGAQEKPEEQDTSAEHGSPVSHSHTKTSENKISRSTIAEWEKDYLWYIWNTFSIISIIRFFGKYLGRNSQRKQEEARASHHTAAEMPLPDSHTLQLFHSQCIQASPDKKWKEEFLQGFADDLLDAMKTVCDESGGMLIEDFQMVDMCNIIVPLTPPDPYCFQCLLWNKQPCDQMPDMQVCGQIKLVENNKIQNGCPCQSPDADDVVCLLHCETENVKTKITDVRDGLLCTKNSPFLSKMQVSRWFQKTIKQAWAQISHKYEIELNNRYIDAPGALVVRFRSGKKISFNMHPVVNFNHSAHFFISSCSNKLDTLWTLSLTNYEDSFLKHISKCLPEHSCHMQTLEIALFLHKRQTALSGCSTLKDSHFKTVLMHLLLTKDPSKWKPDHLACRLRDMLDFMERSLKQKQLHHALIGNPLSQKVIGLPAEFAGIKTVNLFHPLVAQDCIYRNTLMHFQEMLRNANMMIQDYVV